MLDINVLYLFISYFKGRSIEINCYKWQITRFVRTTYMRYELSSLAGSRQLSSNHSINRTTMEPWLGCRTRTGFYYFR